MESVLSGAAEFAGRNVLVTGGTGFIGANLARRLLALGAKVHLLSRHHTSVWRLRDLTHQLQLHRGDVTASASLAQIFRDASPEFVFHLAVSRGNDAQAWSKGIEVSVLGALSLVEQLRNAPVVRLVATGSALEYGPSSRAHREDDALDPDTWHGLGKATADAIFRQAAERFGLRTTTLRLFHVYGPWESAHRLLPTAIRAAYTRTPIELTDRGIHRDWVYVDDVVDAMVTAASRNHWGHAFNVGSGLECSNEELVAIVARLTERAITTKTGDFPTRPTDQSHRKADRDKSSALLNWVPKYDLRAGVAATLRWYAQNPDVWSLDNASPPLAV